jgi:molybdopterin/thiamine biosynthesis adenylyltransferase
MNTIPETYTDIQNNVLEVADDRIATVVGSVINRLRDNNGDGHPSAMDTIEPVEGLAPQLNTNSTTEVIQTTSRFSSAIWFDKIQEQDVILAGVGGIGSYVAFLLSRMKPKSITIYDPDVVETVNMAGQLYGTNDVGLTKVRAVSNMMRNYSIYYSTYAHDSRFTANSTPGNIMICGFDNMEARKTFFNSWLSYVGDRSTEDKAKCLFIDGRLNAEEFQVLCITGDNEYAINNYKDNWLFDDSAVEEAVCSYKQTSYMANMIGSVMTNLFVNFCANMCDPVMPRDVPFLTRYDGTTMFFKTE